MFSVTGTYLFWRRIYHNGK